MSEQKSRPLYGLVLAGGKSERMGTDKSALIHPDGRTLARRSHDLLKESGAETVVISLRHDQEIPESLQEISGLQIARDPEGKSRGPLSGLIAAIQTQPRADWLVLACDLPRLDLETLRHLISSKLPEEMFLSYRSTFDNLPEPLCAIYGEGSLSALQAGVSDGIRCPRKVLIKNGCRLLEPVSNHALDNANTPEDWAAATRKP